MSKARLASYLGAVLLFGTATCQYNPDPTNGEMSCSDSGECPSGYQCYLQDRTCYRSAELPHTPPSTGGATAATTVNTVGAAGASGGTSAVIPSSRTITGGQAAGTTSRSSTITVTGGAAGSSVVATSSKAGAGGTRTGGTGVGGNATGGKATGGSKSSSAGGGSSASSSAAGDTSGPVTCTTDLMTLRSGDRYDWVATTPETCGIQGSIYAFSDPKTCTSPSPISDTPCASGATGCCIEGTTVIDSTYAKYGCGLGLDLNSSGGTSATRSAYAGPAKGFKITLTGEVKGGQKIKIMYSSTATVPSGGTAPYKEVDGPGTYSVLFSDATCPAWDSKCKVVSGSAAYSLKVQMSGGGAETDPVGDFKVCITSITPIN